MSLSWYDSKATQGTYKYIRSIYLCADIRDKKKCILSMHDESCSSLSLRLGYPLHVYVDK